MVSTVLHFMGGKRGWLWLGRQLRALFSTNMSPIMFFLDFYVYPIVILFCLVLALDYTSIPRVIELSIAGLGVWTLAEYLLHRFVLHSWPYFTQLHQAHHDDTLAMVGPPTVFTLLVFFVLAYLPVAWGFGPGAALPWFAGFLSGYLAFTTVHYAVHHWNGTNKLLRSWKKIHAIHHHGSSDHNYGVLTDFWDRVFGTYSKTMNRPNRS